MHNGTTTNLGDLIGPDAELAKLAFIEIGEAGETRRVTHEDMDRLSADFAGALQSAGYLPGESVALIARNSIDFLVAYLGIMRAGLVAVPINWRQPQELILHCLFDSCTRLILTDNVVELQQAGIDTITLSPEMGDHIPGVQAVRPFSPHANAPNDVAMLLYTSGSTGRPKGVELSHASQLFSLNVFAPQRAFVREQVMSIAAPLYHMNGLSLSKLALLMNATVVLFTSFEAERVIRAVPDYGISWLTGIPTMYALMVERPELLMQTDLSSIQRITLGSAPLTDNLVATLKTHVPDAVYANSYGTTEHGPSAFAPHPDGLPTPLLSLGITAPGVETRLVDGPGPDFGVLEVRTPANMNGYRNLPEKTAERMKDGWYNTGDLFRHDENGFHFFVGRADDMFVVNGENVHPVEVERLLERHPSIRQACVIPIEDRIRGAAPVAFVVGEGDEAEIQTWYRAHGRPVETPRRIVFVESLPLAGTNKIDRKAVSGWASGLSVTPKAT